VDGQPLKPQHGERARDVTLNSSKKGITKQQSLSAHARKHLLFSLFMGFFLNRGGGIERRGSATGSLREAMLAPLFYRVQSFFLATRLH